MLVRSTRLLRVIALAALAVPAPIACAEDLASDPPESGVPLAQSAPPSDDEQTSVPASKGLPNPFQDPRDRIFYPGDTERFKPLATKLISNVLLDQKEIWLSPFHMRKEDRKWWIGFGAVTAALIATDHETSTALESSAGQVSWGNGLSQIGAAYTLIPITAGFYGIGVLTNNGQARETGVLGAEALLDSLVVVSVLKPIAGEYVPIPPLESGASFLTAAIRFLPGMQWNPGRSPR